MTENSKRLLEVYIAKLVDAKLASLRNDMLIEIGKMEERLKHSLLVENHTPLGLSLTEFNDASAPGGPTYHPTEQFDVVPENSSGRKLYTRPGSTTAGAAEIKIFESATVTDPDGKPVNLHNPNVAATVQAMGKNYSKVLKSMKAKAHRGQ